jgi:hypothetical protein
MLSREKIHPAIGRESKKTAKKSCCHDRHGQQLPASAAEIRLTAPLGKR